MISKCSEIKYVVLITISSHLKFVILTYSQYLAKKNVNFHKCRCCATIFQQMLSKLFSQIFHQYFYIRKKFHRRRIFTEKNTINALKRGDLRASFEPYSNLVSGVVASPSSKMYSLFFFIKWYLSQLAAYRFKTNPLC